MKSKPPLIDPRRCAWLGPDDQADTHNDQCAHAPTAGKPYCPAHTSRAYRGLPRANTDMDPWARVQA